MFGPGLLLSFVIASGVIVRHIGSGTTDEEIISLKHMARVFSGDTFEGHSLIPAIKAFIRKHDAAQFIVIAGAAMIR